MEMAFFDDEKTKKNIGFSKCRSDNFRGPNRRILGQGIGQNLVWAIFEKVQISQVFSTFWKHLKKSLFFMVSYIPNSRSTAHGGQLV